MDKLTIQDLALCGNRVFVRVDFNVPLKGDTVGDDLRMREALPTLRYILDHEGIPILASHLGRPKGKVKPEFSLAPVARHLSELLGRKVTFVSECVGAVAEEAAGAARSGDVLLLENLRFHAEEEQNDPVFSKQLGGLAAIYVNDAFGTAHRAHASTEGITHYVRQAAAGFLMEKELQYLGHALQHPEPPFVAILGGAKISDKIEVIENLLGKVDRLLIGGAMAFTFLRSQGIDVGKSLCEEDKLELARALVSGAHGEKIVLPLDVVASRSIDDEAAIHVVAPDRIPTNEMGMDIGPGTIARYAEIISTARTIVWNGPMGVFERPAFAAGTMAIVRAVAASKAVSIIGGGDSAAAVAAAGVTEKVTHVSTGGGASLEFLAGRILPGVAALTDRMLSAR